LWRVGPTTCKCAPEEGAAIGLSVGTSYKRVCVAQLPHPLRQSAAFLHFLHRHNISPVVLDFYENEPHAMLLAADGVVHVLVEISSLVADGFGEDVVRYDAEL
jgi:hypothetical protein